MYLSDRDLKFAVETGQLIVDPPPEEYDTTSIDLHLDSVNQAKIWKESQLVRGSQAVVQGCQVQLLAQTNLDLETEYHT
jgi:deoxycytidine triphosphate deaminase